MTGFGKSTAAIGMRTVTVDIRALNSKQLDLNLRLPSVYREKEAEIRNEITRLIERGKVDVFISLRETAGNGGLRVNKDAARAHYAELMELAAELGSEPGDIFSLVMRMPDVLVESEDIIDEFEWVSVRQAITEALKAMDQFRKDEGDALLKELVLRVDNISRLLESIASHEESRMTNVRQKLKAKIDELQKETDANRFEEELIYYLEKLDITEEKQRLKTHCSYFFETINQQESSGRKLGFITQEMGREINTIGSKANHAEMQKVVVLMKDELEKIKEQLNNVL